MVETLRDFIERRRAELTAEKAALEARRLDILMELERLDAAESATISVVHFERSHPENVNAYTSSPRSRIKSGTIMHDIVEILDKSKDGLIALDILRLINEKRRIPIERTSLSPQLSRLKYAGIIELDGSVWRLRRNDQVKKEE